MTNSNYIANETVRRISDTDGNMVWIAGRGQHSHEIPLTKGHVVQIRDGAHEGTEVYRTETGFRFIDLVSGGVYHEERCVLVQLSGVEADDVFGGRRAYGCDLDSPDGLALIGLDESDSTEGLGEVLWDSAEELAQ